MRLDAGRSRFSHTASLVAGMVTHVAMVQEDTSVEIEMVTWRYTWYGTPKGSVPAVLLCWRALVPKFTRNSLKEALIFAHAQAWNL